MRIKLTVSVGAIMAFCHLTGVRAEEKARFMMTPDGAGVTDVVSGENFGIEGRFAPMAISVDGENAWRTDGYSSRVVARVGDLVDGDRMTVSLRMAVDTYPIIIHEQPTEEQVAIISCIDHGKKSGFGFFLGRTGKYSFRMYSGETLVTVDAAGILPLWEWTDLTAVVHDGNVRLFNNGLEVGSAQAPGHVRVKSATFFIGRSDDNRNELGGAPLSAFNGAIRDITVNDMALVPVRNQGAYADLNLPASRYEGDIMRVSYHAAPGMNWTNETHGLIRWNGKYHVFFQKTGSAPVMSHQHWGHLVSEDLIEWRDEKPALAPGESYDIKGCWSGCVFQDDEITGQRPGLLYTGVDYSQPFVAYASTADDDLRDWHKDSRNPVFRLENPASMPHFRDMFFFRNGDAAYFLTGTTKDGHAATLLHKYVGGDWKLQGYFYDSPGRETDGEFAEMPNVTRIGDKWVMTTTPLATGKGVVCLYRTGMIGEDGRFVPDDRFMAPSQVDILAAKGFGMMSPSPYVTPEGKVLAMGIVADKLPTHYNIEHGYAHLYSLPREWSLDSDGDLLQKPYSGLAARRNQSPDKSIRIDNTILDGSVALNPVRGREAEVCATFTIGDSPFGFNFYKTADGRCARLTYDPAGRELSVDFGGISRYDQDEGNPNRFSAVLPKVPEKGELMKLHLFIDHSIIDVFVNDRYASSVRVFPTDMNADLIEVYADGPTEIVSLEGYVMGDGFCASEPVVPQEPEIPESNGKVGMYVGYPTVEALSANPQEKKAYDYFVSAFPGGKVLFSGDADKIDDEDYDCLWIHVDRTGLSQGYRNLPQEFCNDTFITALKNYLGAGGNLYLSKFATQLAVAVGRTAAEPTEFSSGDGGVGTDVWQVNVSANSRDYSSHPAFYSMAMSDRGYGKLVDMLGNPDGLHREDHNCMWRLNDFGGHDRFCDDNNAKVLGTWGHDGGQAFAGIVEFLPAKHPQGLNRAIPEEEVDRRKGTIIANGLAACEWSPRTDGGANGLNIHHSNLEKLTGNIISYLSPEGLTTSDAAGVSWLGKPEVSGCQGGICFRNLPGRSLVRVFSATGCLLAETVGEGDGFLSVAHKGFLIVNILTPDADYAFKTVAR